MAQALSHKEKNKSGDDKDTAAVKLFDRRREGCHWQNNDIHK